MIEYQCLIKDFPGTIKTAFLSMPIEVANIVLLGSFLTLFHLLFFKHKEFLLANALLLFVTGFAMGGIAFTNSAFRHVSGVVAALEYNGPGHETNSSLSIFLQPQLELFTYYDGGGKNDTAEKFYQLIKKGDKIDIVIEDLLSDEIWGIKIENKDILSFEKQRSIKRYFAVFFVVYSILLSILVIHGRAIISKITNTVIRMKFLK